MGYVETTHQNWFSRIGNAIKGIIFGVVLFVIAFPLLLWNEGNSVHTARSLAEGERSVVDTDSAAVDPAKEGKLVHFTGQATNATGGKLADPKFGISQDAIHLRRSVAMYQWKEESKTETHNEAVGGGENRTTTYTYSKVWSKSAIDSSSFKERGHNNPEGDWRYKSDNWDAAKVAVGAYTLGPELINDIDNFTPVSVSKETIAALSDDLKDDAVDFGDAIYLRNQPGDKPDPASPQLGDLKVTFTTALPGPVSVIAKQGSSSSQGDHWEIPVTAYQTESKPLELLYTGTHTAQEMFKKEEQKNVLITWLIRLGGFLMMWIGMALVLSPLKVLADVIGILGDIAGAGIALMTFVVAVALSSATIAIAWIAYRPVIGISMLVVAVGAMVVFFVLRSRGAANRRVATAPAQ